MFCHCELYISDKRCAGDERGGYSYGASTEGLSNQFSNTLSVRSGVGLVNINKSIRSALTGLATSLGKNKIVTKGVYQSVRGSQRLSSGITIVIPTYNEAGTIECVVNRCLETMKESDYRTEILIVDDDSPDDTAQIARDSYATDHRVRVVRRTNDRCLARAVTEGFQRARHEYCAVIDADLQHPPERLPNLLEILEDGADIAIGSRYVSDGGIENWSRYRRFASVFS